MPGNLLQLALRTHDLLQTLLLEDGAEELYQSNLADFFTNSSMRAGAELDIRLERTARVDTFRAGELGRVTGTRNKGGRDLVTLVDVDLASVIFDDGVGAGGNLVQTEGAGHTDTLHGETQEERVNLRARLLTGQDVDIIDVGRAFGGEVPVKSLGKLKQKKKS